MKTCRFYDKLSDGSLGSIVRFDVSHVDSKKKSAVIVTASAGLILTTGSFNRVVLVL